jgi:hypothetical protein
MNGFVSSYGKIVFDPVNKTKKHNKQSSWKRTAMIVVEDDTYQYYQWLIQKRYPLIQGVKGDKQWLNPPLRGTHVTIINDRVGRDFTEEGYLRAKEKYDGKTVYFFFDPINGVRNNGEHIYFKVECPQGDEIRKYAGLGDPYFGFHITIGLVANDGVKKRHLEQVAKYMKLYPNENRY